MYPQSDYILSSNPPNPRTTFRVGDWICPSHTCGAHNFGRNTSCIGCGSLRPSPSNMTQVCSDSVHHPPQPIHTGLRPAPSPRFSSTPSTPSSPASSASSTAAPAPPPTAHPLLTPSGKGFAKGGKVQNISPDPLVPCVMYWPDNEPLPSRGQIRPNTIGSQPPILNTGNRGPISHQPGDWICLKCNYLNWRRRKVCQTCYPYAEGNGDSISVAVQAERIALLTNVLAQTRAETILVAQQQQQQQQQHHHQQPRPVQRSLSLTPPNYPYHTTNGPYVHRSHSQNELGAQFSNASVSPPPSQPILYQTPLPRARQQQQLHPVIKQEELVPDSPLYMPTPLLPSFLQDLVHSPTLSPASTSSSSAELLSEEDEISIPSSLSSARHGSIGQERERARVRVLTGSGGGVDELSRSMSIWSLDGQESKHLSSAHHMYFGPFGRQTGKRGASLERLPE